MITLSCNDFVLTGNSTDLTHQTGLQVKGSATVNVEKVV